LTHHLFKVAVTDTIAAVPPNRPVQSVSRIVLLGVPEDERGRHHSQTSGNAASESVGRETVQYASNIYKYYVAYSLLVAHMEERERAEP